MRNLPQLANAVQRNCDISDARHAGDYGLCTFLLKMREYYRWENELPFAQTLPRDDLGDWLKAREQAWDRLEADEFAPLPLARGELDPFDSETANDELLPQGCVYSAGYGRWHKLCFSSAALRSSSARNLPVYSASTRANCRAGDACRADHLRAPSVRLHVGEVEEWHGASRATPRQRSATFRRRPESALQMADNETEQDPA